MKLYLKVIQFNFARLMVYPLEVLAQGFKRFISVFFFILLWISINNSSNGNFDIRSIIAYYLISNGINEIVGARYSDAGSLLGKSMIKNGEINALLIKPLNILPYVYSISIGRIGVRILISIIFIIVGLFISPPSNVFGLFSGIVLISLATVISFSVATIEGLLFIYFTDAEGLRSSINHFKSLFGGIYIPLYFFPQAIRGAIEVTPFACMVYVPTIAFKFTEINADFIKYFTFSVFWAVIISVFTFYFWKFSRKKYEAIGI